ncbi:cyclase family protein [Natronoarchaeum rubrum]|uniref:cyclase family protein n=1 Tax=Natronoarchaeum rubrum TaxID=755311 RepID=UPI0021110902|nr:cyclase family protein [Natronoarchaeum rubrum]
MTTYDLSQSLDAEGTTYPGDPAVSVTPHATHESDGYRVTELALGSHSGTHVDAPSHLLPDGRNLDEVGLSTFAFDAVRIDCTDHGAREPIGRDAVAAAPTDADLLVVRTGWSEHWGTNRYLDHPYLSSDAAVWLAEQGFHVGVDTPNVDPTPRQEPTTERTDEPEGFPAHRALLGSDCLLVENLRNLGAPPDRFELCAYPLPIPDADGAPARAVARVDEP